jgi:hypothetical protein
MEHGRFEVTNKRHQRQLISSTVDSIIDHNAPGAMLLLLHVDVEGVERDVIKGASNLINVIKAYFFLKISLRQNSLH